MNDKVISNNSIQYLKMKKKFKFFYDYKNHFNQTFESINFENLENIILKLIKIRKQGGRIFCIGVGGSAANASHLVTI